MGIGKPREQHGALALRPGQYLHHHLGQHGQGAEAPAHQLGQIVAGDVLDHPASAAHHLAPPGDGLEAQQVVPRGAGLEAAGAGEIAGQGAAQGGGFTKMGRLEGELLALIGQGGFQSGQGRARPRHQDQFIGLVVHDAGQPGDVQHGDDLFAGGPHIPPIAPLAPARHHLQRLPLFQGGDDVFLDGLQGVPRQRGLAHG